MQTPAPLPPEPTIPDVPPLPDLPAPEVVVMPGGAPEEVLAIVSVVTIVALTALLWPVVRAWARRIETRGAPAQLPQDLEELRDHVEHLQHRVAELEERADFAERLLARGSEHHPVPPGDPR